MNISDGKYLLYDEYKSLGGNLAKRDFIILEFEARKNIDKCTFGRLKDLDSQVLEVKMCIFQIVNILNSYKAQNDRDKSIQSEDTNGYKVTYNNSESNAQKELEINELIRDYLSDCQLEDGTFYLYRGKQNC